MFANGIHLLTLGAHEKGDDMAEEANLGVEMDPGFGASLQALRAATSQLMLVAEQTAARTRSLEAILAIIVATIQSEPEKAVLARCAGNLQHFSASLDFGGEDMVDQKLVNDVLALFLPAGAKPTLRVIEGGKT